MVQAAARGRIDYTQADSSDRLWLCREKFILEALERELDTQRLIQWHMQFSIASLGCSTSDANAQLYQSMQQQSARVMEAIEDNMAPWNATTSEEKWKSEHTKLRQQYINRFGEAPDSPEAQQKVQDLNEGVERQKLQAQQDAQREQQRREVMQERQRNIRLQRDKRKGRRSL